MSLSSLVNFPVEFILPFLVVISIIVFIHEYGHYKVARWYGVKIDAFSIGFGREIFGWTDKHGTRWKYCWAPIGGYVKFAGDANAASLPGEMSEADKNDPTIFQNKPVWQKAAVVAAGPLANFLLAIAIYAAAFMIVGKVYSVPVVSGFTKPSAGQDAGLMVGDVILKIQGKKVTSTNDVPKAVFMRGGEPTVVTIERDGKVMDFTVTPAVVIEKDSFGGTTRIGRIGISLSHKPGSATMERLWPHDAVKEGALQTWFIIATTGKFIAKLVRGEESVKQIGGAISMAKGASDMAKSGFYELVAFIALLSVSIGLINLFPVPMLDGGHLVFYGLEALRGKPLGPQAQEWAFRVGFSVVIMLMLLGFYNDIGRSVNYYIGG